MLSDTNELDKLEHFHKRKKRKSSLMNGGLPQETYDKILKKKKTLPHPQVYSIPGTEFLKYKNTDEYMRVIAKPGALAPTPKIFQNVLSAHCSVDLSDFNLKNFLTTRCFDTDIDNRFTNLTKSIKINEPKENFHNKDLLMEQDESIKNCQDGISEAEKYLMNYCSKKISNINNINPENEKCKKSVGVNEVLKSASSNFITDKVEKELKSIVDTYKTLNKKGLIFHMHHPSNFNFFGEMKITLLSGEVEILGYSLKPSTKSSVDVYSPNFCFPLNIWTCSPKEMINEEEIKNYLKDILTEEDINTFFSKFQPNDSVLLVQQIVSNFGVTLNKYFEKPLFPKDLESVSSLVETVKELQCVFNFTSSKNIKAYQKNIEWDQIPLNHCTVLCGGKGVGKSTLLKYYINKMVSQGEKILCFDFDPGQPEFTAPGCISAVIIDKPLLGPNFTHVTDPKLMVYFGDIDVCQNPSKYLECVNYVIQNISHDEELGRMKWFVNTMGFCKGLGVDLMVTILKLIQPNTVIQISSSDFKKNYPFYLTPVAVNSKKGFKSMLLDVILNFDLRVICSYAEINRKALQSGLKPRQLRDIMSISYFSQMVSPPYYNFNAIQPYLVPFANLYLGIDFLIEPIDILKAFNGNIVSLSHFESGCAEMLEPETETEGYFKIVVKPEIAPSFGLGFVRGINCEEKKFYILTHLTTEELVKVNCLSLGKISPPHSMFLNQETVEEPIPYTVVSTTNIIQRVKRMFRMPLGQQCK